MSGLFGGFGYLLGLLCALMAVAGVVLIRSARRSNRRVWGETVCPGGGCRFRNKPHAKYCARCGKRLPSA